MTFSTQYPIGPFDIAAGDPDPGERPALVDRIARLPERLSAALDGLDDGALDTPYRQEGWTPRQIAHHVADSHMNAFVRFKIGLTEELPTIRAYEQAAWAECPDVGELPVGPSLALLEGLHVRWVHLLRSMDDDAFAREIDHPEAGRLTLGLLLRMYAWHGDHHTRQIEELRERQGW